MKKTVAIIGYGWVGKAQHKMFPDAVIYSHNKMLDGREFVKNGNIEWDSIKGDFRAKVNACDVAFICVPSPCPSERGLDTTIVEECIEWCECPLIVVRSTVNPGDCDKWSIRFGKKIVMQPEYLGETPSHPFLDQRTRPFLVLGGEREYTRMAIEVYQQVYNANISIRQVSALEAEIIKLSENRAIAFKVSECQELYDVCEKAGVDYYTIQQAVYGDDPRFNLWWTFIYPQARGFKSKCIPKDIYAWAAWAESAGYDPKITKAILNKNKEWISR